MTDLPISVAAYPDECEVILSWLRGGDWLHQDEFDRLSLEWRLSPRKVTLHAFTGDTMILPFNGDPLIAILQELCRADMVETRGRLAGRIEYRLKNGA